MCVDTHHYRCCCGCLSLTQATILLGILQLIATISYAIAGQWVNFSVSALISLIYIMVFCKPYDVSVRKILYYLILCGQLVGLVTFVIVLIIYLTSDTYKYDLCANITSTYSDYVNCVDAIQTIFIVVLVVGLLIYVPCIFCVH